MDILYRIQPVVGLGDKHQQLVVQGQGQHVVGQPIDKSIVEFSVKPAEEPNLDHSNPKQ